LGDVFLRTDARPSDRRSFGQKICEQKEMWAPRMKEVLDKIGLTVSNHRRKWVIRAGNDNKPSLECQRREELIQKNTLRIWVSWGTRYRRLSIYLRNICSHKNQVKCIFERLRKAWAFASYDEVVCTHRLCICFLASWVGENCDFRTESLMVKKNEAKIFDQTGKCATDFGELNRIMAKTSHSNNSDLLSRTNNL
jgi:hypothetical protein